MAAIVQLKAQLPRVPQRPTLLQAPESTVPTLQSSLSAQSACIYPPTHTLTTLTTTHTHPPHHPAPQGPGVTEKRLLFPPEPPSVHWDPTDIPEIPAISGAMFVWWRREAGGAGGGMRLKKRVSLTNTGGAAGECKHINED